MIETTQLNESNQRKIHIDEVSLEEVSDEDSQRK